MSGQKRTWVNIEQQEERRLRESDAKLRVINSELPSRLAEIRNATMEEARRQSARMDQRWGEFQNTASRLQSDLAQLERDTQERLRRRLAQARSHFTNLLNQERSDRMEQAERMREEYSSLVDRERSERQQQIGEVQGRLNRIENREENLRQMAGAWLQDLRILQEDIAKLPHERFAPGAMNRINGRISQAVLNLENDASQVSIGQAQNEYFELVELRADVLYREQQFEEEYLRALIAVRSLIEEVRLNRQGVVEDDETQDITVDIDFWSRGMLSQISDQAERIKTRLEKEKDSLSFEEVRQLETAAAELQLQLPQAIDKARMTIINSQACHNVADRVVEVMEAQGYVVEEGVYEGEDQRAAYAVKMRNVGGDEFVTIVTPSPGQELAYGLEMNFEDRNRDETTRQSLADAVYERLNRGGLRAGRPEETMGIGEPNDSMDLEKFRQRQPQSGTVRTR
jgi:hypothetical protein